MSVAIGSGVCCRVGEGRGLGNCDGGGSFGGVEVVGTAFEVEEVERDWLRALFIRRTVDFVWSRWTISNSFR